MEHRLAFAWLWVRGWWHGHKRSNDWWGSLLMLLVAVVSAAFTVYAALRPEPSVAGVSFETGIDDGGGGLRSYAEPESGEGIPILLEVTPHHQDLIGVSVIISPPPRVELTDRCYYTVGDSLRHRCAMPGGEGRIDIARLGSGETLRISANARVVAQIEERETITIEMDSAEDEASQRGIDLFSPDKAREDERSDRVGRASARRANPPGQAEDPPPFNLKEAGSAERECSPGSS